MGNLVVYALLLAIGIGIGVFAGPTIRQAIAGEIDGLKKKFNDEKAALELKAQQAEAKAKVAVDNFTNLRALVAPQVAVNALPIDQTLGTVPVAPVPVSGLAVPDPSAAPPIV